MGSALVRKSRNSVSCGCGQRPRKKVNPKKAKRSFAPIIAKGNQWTKSKIPIGSQETQFLVGVGKAHEK